MNTKLIYWFIISGFILSSCIDNTTSMGDKVLSDIVIESAKDTLFFEFGDEIRISPIVTQSLAKGEINYEWRYRYKSKDQESGFDSLRFLPCKNAELLDIEHFRKVGEYNVRLRTSNDDGSSFHYFTVFVRSTYDKGLMVLSKDDNKKGRLSFLRVMNESELYRDQLDSCRVNAFVEVNPGVPLDNPTDMIFWKDKKMILFALEDNCMYYCDQSLTYLNSLVWKNALKLGKFYSSESSKYLWTKDKKVFLINEDGIYASNWINSSINKICPCPMYDWGFRVDTFICIDDENATIYGDRNKGMRKFEGKEIINAATNTIYSLVILRDKNEPNKITINSFYAFDLNENGGRYLDYTYEPGEITLTKDVEILSEPGYSKTAYYPSGNKLYRWATSGTMPDLPTLPCLTVDGEITCLALSTNWKYIYIGVYDPASTEKLKGSVWIMEIESLKVLKKINNIADRPIKILYKENL